MKLAGCVAVVTGATRGLGRALATTLGARGARLALVARDPVALEDVAAAVRKQGGEARAIPFDLHEYHAARGMYDRIERELGPVDLLICNAATATAGDVTDLPLAAFEESLTVNLLAHAALAQAAARHMGAQRHGTICFILSGAAVRALPGFATYSCGKAALRAFADALRVETRDLGVRVLSVFPGVMDTEFLARMARVGPGAEVGAGGRPRKPEAVARMVVRALERDRERLWVHGPAWLVYHFDHLAASLVDHVLVRRRRRQRRADGSPA